MELGDLTRAKPGAIESGPVVELVLRGVTRKKIVNKKRNPQELMRGKQRTSAVGTRASPTTSCQRKPAKLGL